MKAPSRELCTGGPFAIIVATTGEINQYIKVTAER